MGFASSRLSHGAPHGLWGAAPAGAQLWMGFQTSLSLLHSQGSQKQRPRWSEVEKGHRQPQPPACPRAFSIAGEAMRPRADCDLLWWDEPYNNKITSLPEGARHHIHPRPMGPCAEHPLSPPLRGLAGMRGCRTSVFVLCHSPFSPPMSCFCLVRKKRLRSPCNLFFPIPSMFFFWLVNLFLKSVALCFASIASIPAIQLINSP